ncbi:MAG: hypothetical protein DDT35_00553 [Firmicutes bacterium]|nr:hypothetical protein [Bacillota bacterium]
MLSNEFFKCFSFYILHDDIVYIIVLTNIIDANYVWIGKTCGSLGFATKFGNKITVSSQLGIKDLNGHCTIKQRISAFVDKGSSSAT